jgi:DNA replication protein DnaC
MRTKKELTKKTVSMRKAAPEGFAYMKAITRKAKKSNVEIISPVSTSDLFHDDEDGRPLMTPEKLKEFVNERDQEQAAKNYNNDPDTRLDQCGFPSHNRKFMMEYDYKRVLLDLGFTFQSWDWQYLYGGKGTGKTTLACRQAWEWMKEDLIRRVRYVSVSDWIEGVKGKDGISLEHLPNFVILDDLDKLYYTDWQVNQIFRLIDHLYRRKSKVIITANLSLQHFAERSKSGDIDTAVDRIKERTKKAKICVNWESFR